MAKSPNTAARKAEQKADRAARSGPRHSGTITSRTDELQRPDRKPQHGPEGTSKPKDEIYDEAKDRFGHAEKWEQDSRRLFLDDLKFAEADPDNGFQWPNNMRRNRDIDQRPALTVNKVRQHNLQIINDGKQNKPNINIKPTGEGASFRSAQVFENIVRDIERKSNASVAYDIAFEFAVKAGIGYWTVDCEYVDDDTFDQAPRIKAVPDPLSIYLDPDIKERDGSDGRYAFEFVDKPRDLFEKEHPQYMDLASINTMGSGDNWLDRDHVRVARYWRRTEKRDRLIALEKPVIGGEPDQIIWRESKIKEVIQDPETMRQLLAMPGTRKRRIITQDVEWFKIVGRNVVEQGKWKGKYIPIVRLIGEETVIDGKLDRKGHTRNLKDPQRIYNYWTSAAVEHIALQGKTPWIAAIEAIEGYETYWSTANRVNHSYLPYNAIDDDGNKIEPPQRAPAPEMSNAYMKGMEVSGNEMMYASGQYQAQMGQNENAKSGKAINERQRQGDNATYHFTDNQGIAIRHTGNILVDLIPKIFDTKRVMMILAKDGKQHQITVDPQHPEAHSVEDDARTLEAVKSIFNPNIGRYSVEADMGPSYATQRQEGFEAFTQIISARPELIPVIGDLYFKTADFPLADEAAERVKRTIPANILGEGPTAAETQLQGEVQKLTAMVTDSTQTIAELRLKIKGKEEKRDIDVFEAQSKRLTAETNSIVDMASLDQTGQLQQLIKQTIGQMMGFNLSGVTQANAPDLAGDTAGPQQDQEQPPLPGARKAPDGHYYVPDPARPGKYHMVVH